MIKVAEYIANYLSRYGIEHVFTVTGGGAMHLNDAFGHHPKLKCIYDHHEQACAIAAEGYARLTGKLAAVCVTSGPGGTNAITGVLGGWVDSIPMIVVSGQVKRETTLWSTPLPLRQLGDQECDIVASVSPITKYAVMITDPNEVRYHLEKALYLATHGRGGPVWLDVPLDVQAAPVDEDALRGFDPAECAEETPVYDPALTGQILAAIRKAKKPVILAGTAIRLSGGYEGFLRVIDRLGIPVVTAWNAHDLLWDDHPLYCGRPGTVGTRGGNFIVQNCDLLLVLGCRMNIRMISYNQHGFAGDAYKIVVDIDPLELQKPTVKVDLPVCADVRDVMAALVEDTTDVSTEAHDRWLNWCRAINAKYPATLPEYYQPPKPMNPYAFITELSKVLKGGETIVTGNGAACVITFQAIDVKQGQRIFTNSGCAAMGYGFPAAIGACIAKDGQVLCIDGDGSFQMNMQELATVAYHRLDLKILYFNNSGYHSIRQTQTNLFKGKPLAGVDKGSGLFFPDMDKLAAAYGIPYLCLDDVTKVREVMEQMLAMEGPVLCEVVVDPGQPFSPKLSSRVMPDGSIISPPIDDMFPFLDREEYEQNKFE